MKFTKEEFSENLKKKLTNNGKKTLQQSEQTFSKLVEKLYTRMEKKDDETELEDAVTDYLEDFEEIESNIRKSNSDFIKKWKDEHPEIKPAPPTPPTPLKETSDEKYDLLLKKFEEMEKREQERSKAENIAAKRKELKAALKKDGVDDEDWLDGYVKKLNITEDTDVDEEKKDALKLFNRSNAETPPFRTPNQGGGGGGAEFDLSDLKKKK